MSRLGFAVSSVVLLATLVPPVKAQDPAARYDNVRKIAIGGEGGWDFLEVDAANRKLYIARSTRVIVVDLNTEKVVGEIAAARRSRHRLRSRPESGLHEQRQ